MELVPLHFVLQLESLGQDGCVIECAVTSLESNRWASASKSSAALDFVGLLAPHALGLILELHRLQLSCWQPCLCTG